jgi:hypothetical protein
MTDDFDPHTHHRREDPDTSAQAAENVSTATRHKQLLAQAHLRQLARGSYHGFTALENAIAADIDNDAGHKRCPDLMNMGILAWVKAEDIIPERGMVVDREGYLCRRNPGTNKAARIMVITPEGVEWCRQQGLC